MFVIIFVYFAFSISSANAQRAMQYDYYDSSTEKIYNPSPIKIEFDNCWYCLVGAPEPVELNILNFPINVIVPKGTEVFNHPDYVADPSKVPGYFSGYQGTSQCGLQNNVAAKLLHINKKYAAVEIASASNCSHIGPGPGQPKVIFVDANSVKRENEIVDAGIAEKGDCETCKKQNQLEKIDLSAIKDQEAKLAEADLTIAAMTNDPPDKMDRFKTREDQEHYFKCWATENDLKQYKNGYRQLFEKAADHFQVSFDPKYKRIFAFDNPAQQQIKSPDSHLVRVDPRTLKCISLIESGFDKVKVSNTGAYGLAQLTKSNVKEINCLIKGCLLPNKKFKGDKTGKEKKHIERKYSPWAKKRWDSYLKSVKRDLPENEFPNLYKNKFDKPCPKEIKDADIDSTCPILAIAAMSIYQMKSELGVLGVTDEIMMNETIPMLEADRDLLQLAIASTHNVGETITRKSAESVSKMSDILKKMTNSTDRTKEVSGYIKKIENCMSDGNFDPPWYPPSKADKKRAAECAKTAPSAKSSNSFEPLEQSPKQPAAQ